MHTPLWAECHGYVFKHSEVCQKNCLCICNFIASLTHPSQYFSYMTHYISSSMLLVAFILIQGGIFLLFSLFSVLPHTLFSTHYSNFVLKVKLFSSSPFPWCFCYSEWMLHKYKFLWFNLLQPFFSLKIITVVLRCPLVLGTQFSSPETWLFHTLIYNIVLIQSSLNWIYLQLETQPFCKSDPTFFMVYSKSKKHSYKNISCTRWKIYFWNSGVGCRNFLLFPSRLCRALQFCLSLSPRR